MRFRTITVSSIVLALWMNTGSVYGGDFDQLLQAVYKIESNLTKMIEQETVARKTQIQKLERKIATTNKDKRSGGITDEQLVEVTSQMAALWAEVEGIKQALGKNSQQLASIDQNSWMEPEVSETQIAQLAEQLAVIDKHIETLVDSRNNKHSESSIKPSGPKTTVKGRMYSYGMVDFSDANSNQSEFALSRAYVTLKSKLNKSTSIRITSDFKSIDDKYNIILKYAYLDWKPTFTAGRAKLRFGLQATQYIDHMNKLWGRRYLDKTVSDGRKFLTSSDLGVSTIVGFGPKSKYGFVSLALLNGTSYSDVHELNNSKDINLVSLVKPLHQSKAFSKSTLLMQFYSGTQNKSLDDLMSIDTTATPLDTTITAVNSSDWKRQIVSVGGLLAWKSIADLGFDMNYITVGEGAGQDAVKKRGISLFATLYMKKLIEQANFMSTLNFFGRVDFYDPNTVNDNDRETYSIIGIESVPMKGFKVALNYRMTNYQDSTRDSKSKIYVNTLFKF